MSAFEECDTEDDDEDDNDDELLDEEEEKERRRRSNNNNNAGNDETADFAANARDWKRRRRHRWCVQRNIGL